MEAHAGLVPHDLPSSLVFTPLRIAFLVIAAILARLIVHRLINQAVSRTIGHQPAGEVQAAAMALLDATTLPAERREQR